MAPCKSRGALNILFNLSITIGILLANVINYFTAKIEGGWGWRISLGGAAIPAIFIVVAAFFLPDTPNSMIDRDQPNKARAMLRKIRGVNDEEVEAEFNDLMEASKASKEAKNQWRNITKRKYRPQLTMAVLIPAFQQLTGINVVMFYAPVLFKTIGFGSDASLMAAVITGLVNVLSTFISIYGVDKWGRRILLLAGGSIMCVFQIVLAVFIRWQFGDSGVVTTVLPNRYYIVVVICICAFVFAFAWSWGPLAWLVPSEIFPLEIRSVGQSITVSTNMLLTYGVAQSFLSMLCHMKYGLFIFFACFVAIMTLFIFFFLPETKNIPIEEMSRVWRKHWFWRKFVLEDNSYKGFTGDIENDIVD